MKRRGGGFGGRERVGYGRAERGGKNIGTREDQAETWQTSNLCST